ncbi:MAG: cation diffusion facilitator family transporter [Victivallaceae bacterium]|nr:cation diffusion facilitator family transporter [Victivallaceae bacterium]
MKIHEMSTKQHKILAKLEGWISIFANIVLFAFKLWVGICSNSVAIIADAWHSLSDSVTSVILLFGIKMSDKPADKEHPFGHGRSELIATLVIAILLAVVAFEFICKSIERLQVHESAEYGSWALWAMIITIVSKELMAQYAFWAGKITGMNSLKADAWHHRSDSISSIIILVGILFGRDIWWLDGVLGIIVALIIMYAAYDILKSAIGPLLGRSPEKELIEEVTNICKKYCGGEVFVHHFHIHDYGNHTELTFHIHLDGRIPLREAHAISKKIESELKDAMKITATIHMEPRTEHPTSNLKH